ncbi:hypothetical protein [Paenibacillus sp. QZ-Y1]|uniref:hypothetical protein n=1 Tax=Paenibacillus sp. QZ-Y1 TaxID=3414511 RepID=UPI003F79D707
MKKIYVCQLTGKQFDNELDCLESEFKHGDEPKKFGKLVNEFVDAIEKKFKLTVKRETLNISDTLENYINDRMIHWRDLGFTYTINGRDKKYYKTSDNVGDGRWGWDCEDTIDSLVADFEKEHLIKLRRKFEGVLTCEWDDYRGETYSVGNQKVNDVLAAIVSKYPNKKIRIQVID